MPGDRLRRKQKLAEDLSRRMKSLDMDPDACFRDFLKQEAGGGGLNLSKYRSREEVEAMRESRTRKVLTVENPAAEKTNSNKPNDQYVSQRFKLAMKGLMMRQKMAGVPALDSFDWSSPDESSDEHYKNVIRQPYNRSYLRQPPKSRPPEESERQTPLAAGEEDVLRKFIERNTKGGFDLEAMRKRMEQMDAEDEEIEPEKLDRQSSSSEAEQVEDGEDAEEVNSREWDLKADFDLSEDEDIDIEALMNKLLSMRGQQEKAEGSAQGSH